MPLYLFLITLLPLAEHPLWTRYVGQITVIKYVGLVSLIHAGWYIAITRRFPRYFSTPQSWFFLLFLLINVISYVLKNSGGGFWGFNPMLTYLALFALFLITVTLIDSTRRLNWLILGIVASVAWGSLYVIREWQKWHALIHNFRPGWVVGDSNYFAISALISLPFAYRLTVDRKIWWQRSFCFISMTVILVAFLLASSRGAFLGLVVAFAVLIWRSRRRLRNIAISAMLLTPLIVAPRSPVQRMFNPTGGDRIGTLDREASWKAGLRMIEAHPLAGIGLANFKPQMQLYADPGARASTLAHNTYISIGAELGIPALLVYVSLLFFTYRSLLRSQRRAFTLRNATIYHAAVSAEAALAGSIVGIFFLTAEYQKFVWLVIFVSMLLPRFLENPQKKTSPRTPQAQPVSSATRELSLTTVTAGPEE